MVTKIAILHEGSAKKTNDNALLKLLINDMKLDSNRVEFFGVGSKSNFFKRESNPYALLLSRIEEGEIERILFVVDADYEKNDVQYGGYEKTESALKQMIDDLYLSNYADIYITCDPDSQSGYLESFILSTIPEKHKICIENFLHCSDFKSKKNDKSILNQIYKIAYPKAPFDFAHKNFDGLKQKIRRLFATY
jgi:hypothetical protein